MKVCSLVEPRLPRAGLGNMLLVWARAVLFAEINSLPTLAPTWNHFHIGPWLRGERFKRHYGGLFLSHSYLPRSKGFMYRLTPGLSHYYNPPMATVDELRMKSNVSKRCLFIFDKLPTSDDYFVDLKENQLFIKNRLLEIIKPSILERIYEQSSPEIGLHIRLGDFQQVTSQEDFLQNRFASTPLNWFVQSLNAIRRIAGYDVPATIFTDGYEHQVAELLKLPNVSLSVPESALTDMLTLARSKLILASSHSTFSGWASYLGQCPTVWHPGKVDHYQPVFSREVSKKIYEGGLQPESELMPNLLVQNIQDLFRT
jgi:hypothetical protein